MFPHRHRDVCVSSRSQPQLAPLARAQAAAQQPPQRRSGGQRGSPPPLKAVDAPAQLAETGVRATMRPKIANSVTELIGDTPMVCCRPLLPRRRNPLHQNLEHALAGGPE